MGAVKSFAMWLAERVYLSRWSDEEIITNVKSQYPDFQRARILDWLRIQIQTVRENPDLYQVIIMQK
jgi:hypothetical protein